MSDYLRPDDPILGPTRGTQGAAWDAAKRFVGTDANNAAAVMDYIAEVYRLAPLVGMDPAILVSQSALETGNWTSAHWLERRNPAGIGVTDDFDHGYAWADGTDAARGQVAHMTAYVHGDDWDTRWPADLPPPQTYDPRWSAVFGVGWDGTVETIAGLTGKWATDPDYDTKLCRRGNALFGFTEDAMPFTTTVPGLPKAITTSFPVRIALMPASQTNQRPGQPFTGGTWDWYTQHETANTGNGANVRMHEAWLRNGAGGQQLGFHLCVDDREAAVFVPLDEIAWHAGDSGGPGNYDSIACELCVNSDGNKSKSRANAEELAAAILVARGLPVDRLVQHNKWSGKDCPKQMRADGYWPTFVANVGAKMGQGPTPDLDYPDGWDEAIASAVWGDKYKEYRFNEEGVISGLWLSLGITSPLVYHFKDTTDGRELFIFSSGDTIGRLNSGEAFRLLA